MKIHPVFRLGHILVKPSQHENCFSNLVLASLFNSFRHGSAICKSPDLMEAALFSYSWKGPHYKMKYFWHQDNSCNVTAAASWWYLLGSTSEGALLAIMRKRKWEGLLDKILCSSNTVKFSDLSQVDSPTGLFNFLKVFYLNRVLETVLPGKQMWTSHESHLH